MLQGSTPQDPPCSEHPVMVTKHSNIGSGRHCFTAVKHIFHNGCGCEYTHFTFKETRAQNISIICPQALGEFVLKETLAESKVRAVLGENFNLQDAKAQRKYPAFPPCSCPLY